MNMQITSARSDPTVSTRACYLTTQTHSQIPLTRLHFPRPVSGATVKLFFSVPGDFFTLAATPATAALVLEYSRYEVIAVSRKDGYLADKF